MPLLPSGKIPSMHSCDSVFPKGGAARSGGKEESGDQYGKDEGTAANSHSTAADQYGKDEGRAANSH